MEQPPLIAERYRIKGVLGRGGMGEVYLAHDHRLDTDVALKRVPRELALEATIRDSLVREAQILARLSDTHIVRLFDLADTPDGMFLVLEYVCGPSLDKVLEQRKTLSGEELQHVMQQVAQALSRAHGMGIIHRDLKPGNLLLAFHGQDQRNYLENGLLPPTLLGAEIKVADFGLAKVVQQTRVEASGMISGTPAYMAPEQFRGELPSPETDIYSLGFVAYRCLAGAVPLNGAEPVYFHLHVTPPPIAGVPQHVNAAIQKAVRKERGERFHSASDFAAALVKPPVIVKQSTEDKPTPAKPTLKARPQAKVSDYRLQRDPVKFAKFLPKYFLGVGVLGLVILVFALLGRKSTTNQGQTTYGPAAGVSQSASSVTDAPAPLPLNRAPRIDALPPVIESARIKGGVTPPPPGVDRPAQLARITVPGHQVFGFGPDGTLYVHERESEIGAVRNGKLAWQFKLNGDAARFKIAPDGLIWIRDDESGALFCFNAIGQGGEFLDYSVKQKYLAAYKKLPEPQPAVQCLRPDAHQNLPAVQQLPGPGRVAWKTTLDQECRDDPLTTTDGKTVLLTKAGTLYLLSPAGQILWTHTPTCELDRQLTLLNGDTVVGVCSDGLHLMGVQEGKQKFSIASTRRLSVPFAVDSAGTFYRLDVSDDYNVKILTRTDSAGHDIWTLPVPLALDSTAALGPDRKLYVLTRNGPYNDALIYGDSAK